ncbi:MAG: hypothetical protein M3033_10875 [Acidobacteriota bacterium]|nr:hypothetical protein [Acidobacteriota bacterium]
MKEKICRQCGAKPEETSLNSSGFCQQCDISNSQEIHKLKFRKGLFGMLTLLFFLVLFSTFIIPLMTEPDSSGRYLVKGASKPFRSEHLTLTALWTRALFSFIPMFFTFSLYFYFKRKLSRKVNES